MTNTNAGKDIVLDKGAYKIAREVWGQDFTDRALENAIIAYKVAEQKAVPGDEELVEKNIDFALSLIDFWIKKDEPMKTSDVEYIGTLLKAALSTIRQHKPQGEV